MRLMFLGSPGPVVAPLQALIAGAQALGHEVVGVVSQPARPAGRGRVPLDPAVAAYAKSKGIPTLQPERANSPEFLAAFAALRPDIAITAAYGQILSDEFLRIPRRATINIHPSLLPKYRGATPVPAALLAGEEVTGITILFTVKKLDAGAIIVQQRLPIHPDETAGELTARSFAASGALLLEALRLLEDPAFSGTLQDEAAVTHCRKIDKQNGAIDWQRSSVEIYNAFRAYDPWPGAFTYLHGKRISLIEMKLDEDAMSGLTAGQAQYDKRLRCLRIGAGSGTLQLFKLKGAGAKEVSAEAFWNGLKDRSSVVFQGADV